MSHSYKILNAVIERDHAQQRDFLDVEVQIYLDKKTVGDPRRFGFKLDSEEAVIRAELDRVVASMDADAASHAANAQNELEQEKAKTTINALLLKAKKSK